MTPEELAEQLSRARQRRRQMHEDYLQTSRRRITEFRVAIARIDGHGHQVLGAAAAGRTMPDG